MILDRCRLKLRGADDCGGRRARGVRPPPGRAQARPALPRPLPRRRPQGDRLEGARSTSRPMRYEEELEEWLLERLDRVGRAELEADARLRGAARRPDRARGRRCVRLRYGERPRLPARSRERLGKEPNAVHQIHYRALAKLRKEADVNEATATLFDEFATALPPRRGARRRSSTSSGPATTRTRSPTSSTASSRPCRRASRPRRRSSSCRRGSSRSRRSSSCGCGGR